MVLDPHQWSCNRDEVRFDVVVVTLSPDLVVVAAASREPDSMIMTRIVHYCQ